MEHWRLTMERANRHFQLGELVDAREFYLQALALAQVLFGRWPDAEEAVAACVISHHNLADLHLRLNQPEESVEYLCAIHQHLLQTLQDSRLAPELRQAALHQSSKTYVELLAFISEYGEYPRTSLLLHSQASTPGSRLAHERAPGRHPHGVH